MGTTMGTLQQQPQPWRPPLWPFRVPERLGGWLRWIARVWLVVATVAFVVGVFQGRLPRGLDRQSSEVMIQLALLGIVVVGELLAWRWQAIGASVITAGAIALGVMAAIEHSPINALLVTLIFFLPAFLYWLDWQRTRSIKAIVTLAVALSVFLAAGGIRANQVYQSYRGPTHPASPLRAAPVTLVEWIWSGAQTTDSITVNAKLVRDSEAVYLLISEFDDLREPAMYGPVTTNEQSDRIVSITAEGLEPDTRYYYAVQADSETDRSRLGHFKTFADKPFTFTFAVGGCALTGSNGQVFDSIRESDPLFYLALGDVFY
ncbi:MAG: PhoD-like phosphatase N-terminal domain-containing protein, partial [Dehalococcoidia bacterium]